MIDEPIRAWLDVIAWCEGTDGPNGYRTMFTHKLFTDFRDHPRQLQRSRRWSSDAAGRYQFLSTTWDRVRKEMQLPDFSPDSQDQGAVWLIDGVRGALGDCKAFLVHTALDKLSWEWASLPDGNGNGRYSQPIMTIPEIKARLRLALRGTPFADKVL